MYKIFTAFSVEFHHPAVLKLSGPEPSGIVMQNFFIPLRGRVGGEGANIKAPIVKAFVIMDVFPKRVNDWMMIVGGIDLKL